MKYFIFICVYLLAIFQQLVFCADSSAAVNDWVETHNRAAPNIILPLPDTCPLPPLTYPVPVPIVPVYPAPPIFPPYPPPPVFPPYPPPPSYR